MIADSDTAQPDLVTIRTFASESEAQIAKSALDAFEIDSILNHDDCGGQRPHLTLTGGIQLIVNSADAERAEEALTSRRTRIISWLASLGSTWLTNGRKSRAVQYSPVLPPFPTLL